MSNTRERLDEAYEQRGAKSYHVRNDMDQKRLLVAFLKTSNRRLRERESNQQRRSNHTTIDVVVNQYDGYTEVYVPVKQNQDGRLCTAVDELCRDTLRGYARKKPEAGEFKKFIVYRSDKDLDADLLAEKIYDGQPQKFRRYGIEVLPATQCYFSSDAEFGTSDEQDNQQIRSGQRSSRRSGAIVHTSGIDHADIQKIRTYEGQGLDTEQISKKMDDYSPAQVAGVLRHIAMGTYDRPMQEISESLQKKIFKAFSQGKTHQEVAEQFGLNKFQAIAQKAQHTRKVNLGEI